MPKKTTPYIYGPQDDPLKVANQFGITPQELLAANPGGFPFSTGQNILVPTNYQYSAPIGPSLTNPFGGVGGTPYGPTAPSVRPIPGNASAVAQGVPAIPRTPGSTYFNSEKGAPALSSAYGTDDSWFSPVSTAGADTTPPGILPTPAGNTDYNQTQAAQNYAANNTSFGNQMRWDPQARKYVSISRLIKQGKLDLKGNWRKQSKRQKRAAAEERNRQVAVADAAKQKEIVQEKQDYTLANSFITFGVSSG